MVGMRFKPTCLEEHVEDTTETSKEPQRPMGEQRYGPSHRGLPSTTRRATDRRAPSSGRIKKDM
ncbi:hypothetical protein EYF80_046863 [Liparis tanakae]|uniref:Uncharacterized protein n=1 Tax=Liparis tanakae TaxID=230148 RepID=A0A4Z2FRD4_9TELE|nr:hypothetical protein EYF80_046863 [Liparis tanakae]